MRTLSNLVRLFLILAVGAAVTTSCRAPEDQPSTPRLWSTWFSNPKEYATNDVGVAQKETPFRIALPSYLPEDLGPLPTFQGRAKSDFDDELPITITYSRKGHTPITILEFNRTIVTVPPHEAQFTWLTYSDTAVLELPSETWLASRGEMILVPGWTYTWNENGVAFDVRIYEYEVDVARAIVKSMVQS